MPLLKSVASYNAMEVVQGAEQPPASPNPCEEMDLHPCIPNWSLNDDKDN